MYALPAVAPPAPQRQVLVGVALAVMAAVMMTGSMLAVWALQRRDAIDIEGSWLPDGVTIPEVPTNVMLLAFIGICISGSGPSTAPSTTTVGTRSSLSAARSWSPSS